MNFRYKKYFVELYSETAFDGSGPAKWFATVGNRLETFYRGPPFNTSTDATADAKAWIDRNTASPS
jgi:hypothetical protein